MKFSFQVSNVLGAVYRKGNLLFTPDGNSLITPVGNRICIYDLKKCTISTLPVESKFNYEVLALSPSGTILIAVNEEGEAHLISLVSCRKIYTHRFNEKVRSIKFSPDGKLFAVCKINKVFVFRSPSQYYGQYSQFVLEKVFSNFRDNTTCIDWSDDSRILAVGSKDGCTKLFSVTFLKKFRWCVLASHSDSIVSSFFEKESLHINTLSKNGQLCIWESTMRLGDLTPYSAEPPIKKKKEKVSGDDNSEDDIDLSRGEERESNIIEEAGNEINGANEDHISYKRLAKHYLNNNHDKNCKLKCASYNKKSRILVTGFSNGAFFIHELPDVILIHSLSISEYSISTLIINDVGEWIALACGGIISQLLVWEWQSETYVLKQQMHSSAVSCVSYSPDGLYIATGGEDGKVKVWNTQTGFCFVTFSDHTSAVTSVKFGNNKKFLVSSSLDGTIRAFDLVRYRNFRTFTSPKPVQFSCVSIDYTGEFVAAGGQDVFEIYLWSMKIGRLLECLSGHEGPVVSLSFNPSAHSSTLVSVSWDKTLRIWNAIESDNQHETVELLIEGLCVAYRPDGKELVVSTLNGHLKFFDTINVEETRSIEGRVNLGSGRNVTDMITAKQNLKAKAFTSVCYSPDGNYVIAGGQSKYVCIYNVAQRLLIKKFQITQNQSFDGVNEFINHRKLTEFGNVELIEHREENEGGDVKIRLPGVMKGDMAARSIKPEIRVYSIAFSPTGSSWVVTTTEGVLMYSLNHEYMFEPFHLDINITPDSIKKTLADKDYAKALMMALRLNVVVVLQEVIETVPPSDVELTVRSLHHIYCHKLIKYIANAIEFIKHVEFYLLWIKSLLTSIDKSIEPTVIYTLQRNLSRKYTDFSRICDFNKYTARVIIELHDKKKQIKEEEDNFDFVNEILMREDKIKDNRDTNSEEHTDISDSENEKETVTVHNNINASRNVYDDTTKLTEQVEFMDVSS